MYRPLARLLVDSLQQRPGDFDPAWAGLTTATVVQAADEHRIAPAIYTFLSGSEGTPPEWLPPLRGRYDDQLLRHLITSADLEIAAHALDDAGLNWLVMKGPVLSDALWPRPDMRQYFDLDILVDRHRFADAIEALEAAGARLLDRNWPLIRWQVRAELTLVLPHGTSLDLHWDLVNDHRTRAQMRVPTAMMLSRAVPVQIGGLTSRTFDKTDTLLTLALHTAHAGATRLMWLKDIDQAARVPGLDWSEVDSRSRTSGLGVALRMVLARTSRVLGTAKPDVARAGLWPVMALITDRLCEVPRLPGDKHTGQLVYRSARSSGLRSAGAAMNTVLRPPPGSDEPGNPLHRDVASTSARTSYLRIVERDTSP